VLPVSFFIAALGMSIGVGGSSIISRALGANNPDKALNTFGNQITLTLVLTISMVVLGLWFIDDIVPAFGGKGNILEPARIYYTIVLYGVPFLALSMMGNTVIRAEGKPKFAMYAMMIPSVGNLVLGFVTLARQAVVSMTYLFMNNILFNLGFINGVSRGDHETFYG